MHVACRQVGYFHPGLQKKRQQDGDATSCCLTYYSGVTCGVIFESPVPGEDGLVKIACILIMLLLSFESIADPGDKASKETRKADRKKARIERRMHRLTHPFDERSQAQKKLDLRIVLLMALGAGLAVKTMSGE